MIPSVGSIYSASTATPASSSLNSRGTKEGGHMELQAIRYAAMVSRITFLRAVKTYQSVLDKSGGGDGRAEIVKWLRTSEPPSDDAVLDVRIVLISADFAKELT